MSWIFKALKGYISHWSISETPKQRVKFTGTTFYVHREQLMQHLASPIPFQNFLNELRLTAMDERGRDRMTVKESTLMRKSAVRTWCMMNEKQRNKYKKLACPSKKGGSSKTRPKGLGPNSENSLVRKLKSKKPKFLHTPTPPVKRSNRKLNIGPINFTDLQPLETRIEEDPLQTSPPEKRRKLDD